MADMKIDEVIRLAEEREMPEVAAVLAFTKANGTMATLGLLAAADRHANAGLLRRLRTEGQLDRAVARIKDGPWAEDARPWVDLDDKQRADRAALTARIAAQADSARA